jgi:hypothetical protein
MTKRSAILLTPFAVVGRLAWPMDAGAQSTGDLTVPVQPPSSGPNPDSGSALADSPQLKPNPLEALRNFEPAEDEKYRLGKGDEITVDFAGRPDLTSKLAIGLDGRISPAASLATLTLLEGGLS